MMETVNRNELDTLREGEKVMLVMWKNRKDGTRLIKVNDTYVISSHNPNEKQISLKKSQFGKKKVNKDDYGITWIAKKCKMSN